MRTAVGDISIDSLKNHPNLPRHVAIIMDGNGRWAKQKGLARVAGHTEGINSVREVVEVSGQLGIEYLTLYTFSQENWLRPKTEVNALMSLLLETIQKEIENLHKNKVRVILIGNVNDLPKASRTRFLESVEYTRNNTGLKLVLALSYGSRAEILEAVKSLADDVKSGRYDSEDITPELFESRLYTKDIPDPDLLIRTSGELRLSNFLLWQIAYSELFITSVFWPAFRKAEFLQAIYDYTHRERRFGKVSEQLKS